MNLVKGAHFQPSKRWKIEKVEKERVPNGSFLFKLPNFYFDRFLTAPHFTLLLVLFLL